jgi:hypothetical protein
MQRWLSISLLEKYVSGDFNFSNQSLYAMWEYYLVYKILLTEPASLLIHLFTKFSVVLLLSVSIL